MRQPTIIPRRTAVIALTLLVVLILLAAVVNVPWALTRMRSRENIVLVPTVVLESSQVPGHWPTRTPHASVWPAPETWEEGGVFGCRTYHVGADGPDPSKNGFSMEVQQIGWPFAVIELKQAWWDWDNPALAGPESDPAPTLMLKGLILNPLIVGSGAWLISVMPWLIGVIAIRSIRRRSKRCMQCGYLIGTSPVCTECGTAVLNT